MKSKVSVYVYATLLLGAGLAARTFVTSPLHGWLCASDRFAAVVAFAIPVALIVISELFPVRLVIDGKMSASAAVIMAVLLLYPVSEGVVITGLAIAIANLLMRRELSNVVFNVGQYLVASAITGSMIAGLDLLNIGTKSAMMLFLAGATFMILNSALVAGVITLHQNVPFHQQLTGMMRSCWVQHGCLVLIGVLGAAIYRALPAATVLVLIPLILVHRSYEDQVMLRSQTKQTLEFLADVIDSRDSYTFQHSQRVAENAARIAAAMGLGLEERELVVLAARVHDIGKIGTNTEILMKKGSLSPEEMQEIRKHPIAGAKIVGKLAHYKGIRELVLFHHKRFDGTGYPEGQDPVSGRLPLGAAIIAVADAFDAMTSDRPYRRALPVGVAIQELKKNAGTQFAPDVVKAFVEKVLLEGSNQTALAGELVPRYQE
ncbi:MAG: HD-GYP domain-containing protein [Bacillota bacterium]